MIEGGNKMPMMAPAAAPPQDSVQGGHLVLVDVHLPGFVLGDHRGVVCADCPGGVKVLHQVVVVSEQLQRLKDQLTHDLTR